MAGCMVYLKKKIGKLTYIYVHWKKYGKLTLSTLSSI